MIARNILGIGMALCIVTGFAVRLGADEPAEKANDNEVEFARLKKIAETVPGKLDLSTYNAAQQPRIEAILDIGKIPTQEATDYLFQNITQEIPLLSIADDARPKSRPYLYALIERAERENLKVMPDVMRFLQVKRKDDQLREVAKVIFATDKVDGAQKAISDEMGASKEKPKAADFRDNATRLQRRLSVVNKKK